MFEVPAYAAQTAKSPLAPFKIKRRDPGPHDIQIDILFCGVCHSDLHTVRNEWTNSVYPVVAGHEIIGRVIKAGAQVRNFKEGDLAAVGCMVDSCRKCDSCRQGLEQFCEVGFTGTYNAEDKHLGGMTFGGYSNTIVVDDAFVLQVPKNLELSGVAPLLCAGITTYSPLHHWKVGKGQKVGIVGLGGLGHMGVKLAHALGAEVVLFTTSPGKKEDARRLGADEVVVSKNQAEMDKQLNSFHFILDTVSAPHDLNAYLNLLRRDGTLTLVGAPDKDPSITVFN
jgi:alcohol dehydrogenase (NADP+)